MHRCGNTDAIEGVNTIIATEEIEVGRRHPLRKDLRKGFADPIEAWSARSVFERHDHYGLGACRSLRGRGPAPYEGREEQKKTAERPHQEESQRTSIIAAATWAPSRNRTQGNATSAQTAGLPSTSVVCYFDTVVNRFDFNSAWKR